MVVVVVVVVVAVVVVAHGCGRNKKVYPFDPMDTS